MSKSGDKRRLSVSLSRWKCWFTERLSFPLFVDVLNAGGFRNDRRRRKRRTRRWQIAAASESVQALEVRAMLSIEPISVAAVPSLTAPGALYTSSTVSVSDDGRFITFGSSAGNLVTGKVKSAPNSEDVFLRDRQTGTTVLVSHAGDEITGGNRDSYGAQISGDGSRIVFFSGADNLVPGLTYSSPDRQGIFLYEVATGNISVVNHIGDGVTVANGWTTQELSLNLDGSRVAFSASSTNLVPGLLIPGQSGHQPTQAYLYSSETGSVTLVSHAGSNASAGNGFTRNTQISRNGEKIVFVSDATNLVENVTDANRTSDVYAYQVETGKIKLISRSANALSSANGKSDAPRISDDGTKIVYQTWATNLISGITDNNGAADVYLFDTTTQQHSLISHTGNANVTGNRSSTNPQISGDGSRIAFQTGATDLVPGIADENGSVDDVYLYTLPSGTRKLVSHIGDQTTTSNGYSSLRSINVDGSMVLIATTATNLVSGVTDQNQSTDLYVYRTSNETLQLVSRSFIDSETTSYGGVFEGHLSRNVPYAVFHYGQNDRIAGDFDMISTVIGAPLDTGTELEALSLVAQPSNVSAGFLSSFPGSDVVSDDGRFVVFSSTAENLVPGQTSPPLPSFQVFLRDRLLNTTVLVSHTGDGLTGGNSSSLTPKISGDGSKVVFQTSATDLVPGVTDENGRDDLIVYDVATGDRSLVTQSSTPGIAANFGGGSRFNISQDGSRIAFSSNSTDLIDGLNDVNGNSTDIFLYDVATDTITLVSHVQGAPLTTGNRGASWEDPKISVDGARIVYTSAATNLVAGAAYPSGWAEFVYVYDVASGTNVLASRGVGSGLTAISAGEIGMSGDGARVVYTSREPNVVSGVNDSNGREDVFLFEVNSESTVLVSRSSANPSMTSNGPARSAMISRDGSLVVFYSGSTDMVPETQITNGSTFSVSNIYAFEIATGQTKLLTHSGNPGINANGQSLLFGMSEDGNRILIRSTAANFAGIEVTQPEYNKSHNYAQLYLYDLADHRVLLLSRTDDGAANEGVMNGGISADGSYIVFSSHSTNLVPNDFFGYYQKVFGLPLNLAPSGLTLLGDTLPENRPVGTLVGTLFADDDQGQEGLMYELVAGEGDTDNGRFSIVGNQLVTAEILDYEFRSGYSIRVRVSDAETLSVTRVFTIHVTDVDEAPKISRVLRSGHSITAGERLLESIDSLTARFSLNMNTTGGSSGAHSVINPAHWSLSRNGADISSQIAGFNYAFNSFSGHYEMELTFAAPLTPGDYVLTAGDAIQDAEGYALDGDADDNAGGHFVFPFRIRIPQRVGSEFLVNTRIPGDQVLEHATTNTVAMDAQGNFIVVWTSHGQDGGDFLLYPGLGSPGVFAQRFNNHGQPIGHEFQVNTRVDSGQSHATVAMNSSGEFVIVWVDDHNDNGWPGQIYARQFDSSGQAQGPEFKVSDFSLNHYSPAVAMNDSGDFVVVWHWASGANVAGRLFAAVGTPVGATFRVNTPTFSGNSVQHPAVAMSRDGSFVVTWTSGPYQETGTQEPGGSSGIYGQRFDRFARPEGPEFRVNSTILGDQTSSSVALDANGNFVVTWTSHEQDGDADGIFAQRFSSQGERLGGEFQVNTTTDGYQSDSRIAMSENGDFVIVWWSGPYYAFASGGGNSLIMGQRYSSGGVPQGGEFQIDGSGRGNLYTPDLLSSRAYHPAIAMTPDGSDFVVAWTTLGHQADGLWDIYARRFSTGNAPANIGLSPADVYADVSVGTVVGLLSVEDPDIDESHVFTLLAGSWGSGSPLFTIVGNQLRVAQSLGSLAQSTVRILVRVTDSDHRSFDKILTVRVKSITEPPIVRQVTLGGGTVHPQQQLLRWVPQLIVGFSDEMLATGVNSVTNPANWVLTRNGLNISQQIVGITFALNPAGGNYEAAVAFQNPLGTGDYVLTAKQTLRTVRGILLDGDSNGTSGGDYSISFTVRQPQRSGPQFRVNSTTATRQFTYSDNTPNFGGHSLLNRSTAMNADGGFVVTWQSEAEDGGVMAQRFAADGQPAGPEFQVNTQMSPTLSTPEVAMNAAGEFVIVWADYHNHDGYPGRINARRFDAAGNPLGDEFQVNAQTLPGHMPRVVMNDSGAFAVLWFRNGEIHGRMYDAQGNSAGPEEIFRQNIYESIVQFDAALDAHGNLTLVWSEFKHRGEGYYPEYTIVEVWARRFSSSGIPLGIEYRIDQHPELPDAAAYMPMVAMDATGRMVVVWTFWHGGDGGDGIENYADIYARRLDEFGVPDGDMFRVNTIIDDRQWFGTVAMNATGDFIVAWSGVGQADWDYGTIFARRYSRDGVPQSDEIRVSEMASGTQWHPSVSMNAQGAFVIAWNGYGNDDDTDGGVYARRFGIGQPLTDISLSSSSVPENAPSGTPVGLLNGVDVDSPERFTFEFAAGEGDDDNASFIIVGNELRTAAVFDFESRSEYSVRIRSTDAGGFVFERSILISIQDVNERPVISQLGNDLTYTEKSSPILITTTAIVTDPDAGSFAGGSLRIQIISGGEVSDRLAIRTVGTSVGQINVQGNQVFIGSILLGTFTGGNGTSALIITLNNNATPARVQMLLRNITYSSVSNNPSTTVRTVRVFVNDGELNSIAVTKEINVIPVNDRPEISEFGSDLTYTEKNAPQLITSTALVTDVDSSHFNGGSLRIQIISGGEAADRLAIRTVGTNVGQINVQGNQVFIGSILLGTFTGGNGTSALIITLNGNATPARVQVLLRNITYSNASSTPSASIRTVRVFVNDGELNSIAVTRQITVIPVNDRPEISNLGPDQLYREKGAPISISATAIVTDVDSPNFAGGNLRIQIVAGGEVADRLQIRTVGTNIGQINVQGNQVFIGSILLGTFTGGNGTTALVISLNSNATPARVQVLLRNITFSNVSFHPSVALRTIRVTVDDGNGATSLPTTVRITVTRVNDRPEIADPGTDLSFREKGAPVAIMPQATVTDADSTHFSGGTLRIQIVSGGDANDRLQIRTVGTNAGQINVQGHQVFLGGILLGSFTGGNGTTPLEISLTASATPARVQTLLRNITFSNVSANPSAAVRTIRVTVSVDDGATSVPVTKRVSIVAVNDRPEISDFGPDVSYRRLNTPVQITSTATVADVDSPHFAGGILHVRITNGGESADRLQIRTVGTNAGQINVQGNQVFLGSILLGTFTGGNGTSPLTITLTAGATPARVQVLLRNITFSSVSSNPSRNNRTIRVTVGDGNGETSIAVLKKIDLSVLS